MAFKPSVLLLVILMYQCTPDRSEADFLMNKNDFPIVGVETVGTLDDLDSLRIYQIVVGDSIHFDFVGKLKDGAIIHWDFGDGSTDVGPAVVHRFAAAQRYEVKCCIDSSRQCISKYVFGKARLVAVVDPPPPDIPPDITVKPPPPEGPQPKPCTKRPRAKCVKTIEKQLPSGGGSITISPDDMDGGSSPGCEAIVERSLSQSEFNSPGTVRVTMTIKNNVGLTASCKTTVKIKAAPVTPSRPQERFPSSLKNNKTAELSKSPSPSCIKKQDGDVTFSIEAKNYVNLRSAVLWSDICGRLSISITGPDLNESDEVVLNHGRNDIPLQELYANLWKGKTYKITLRPMATEKCGGKAPRLDDFLSCQPGNYNDDNISIQYNGHAVLFNLKYTFQ